MIVSALPDSFFCLAGQKESPASIRLQDLSKFSFSNIMHRSEPVPAAVAVMTASAAESAAASSSAGMTDYGNVS